MAGENTNVGIGQVSPGAIFGFGVVFAMLLDTFMPNNFVAQITCPCCGLQFRSLSFCSAYETALKRLKM